VFQGVWEGFWPWANTHFGEYPDILDLSLPEPENPDEAQFLHNQQDHLFTGHFSESFGDKLLPGMYCMPIFVVPKLHFTDLQMVTDQSAGKVSLNSMIPCEDIISYPLDNLQHLDEFLISMHKGSPGSPCILFKSDIAKAYWLLPVHPYWQLKQINHIGASLHINRNTAFSVDCLHIAGFMDSKEEEGVELLGTYSDDSFGPELANNVSWYMPYCKFMPTNQVKLLQLWDEINLPHKESKQIFGSPLTAIGIKVDANTLYMTMPPDMLMQLVMVIQEFITTKHKFALHEWQRLAGWINWSLNVFLLLRPALNNFYTKISGKSAPNKFTRINNAVHTDLK